MSYCTVTEVREMLKSDMLSAIIGNDYEEDTEEREKEIAKLIPVAIADADAEIDGYLAKRYSTPMDPVPKVIHKFSKDIAVYNLSSRKGIDEDNREKTVLTRYNAAIKFLSLVSEGKVELGVSSNADAASKGFKMKSSRRSFSRESMKGW